MQRRTAGIVLLGIAAFLYGVRYISAAIFGSNVSSWGSDLFKVMLNSVGEGPIMFSRIAFIAGVIYLVLAEFETPLKKIVNDIKSNWNKEL